jgi:ADP-heptose:LPS heptosyltransferase
VNPLAALAKDGENGQGFGAPLALPAPRRILVLQLARLGDLVQTWPLLTRLRQAYPGARLTLLTDHRLLPLQAAGPQVDEVLGFDFLRLGDLTEGDWPGAYHLVADFLKGLHTREFDLVFNLNFSRLSLLLTHLLGVPAKGYLPGAGGREFSREPWLAWIYSLVHARRFNRFHLTDVFRHLAPEPGAAPVMPPPFTPPRGEPVIALQLATRHERRTWPLEHFTRLAEYLAARLQARILLLGTKAERPLGERLRGALNPSLRKQVLNLQGQTGLAALAEQLKNTNLLVSGDTGTLHLATSLGVPTVALFLGPALCFETGPYGWGHYVLQAEPPCHPCLEAASPCPEEGPVCLEMLPPPAVARLISGLLEEGAVPPGLSLPAGSRLYLSELDDFGVVYQYLGEEPPRFLDLVGQAYRQAGAWLAGRMNEVGGGGEGPWAPPPTPNRERKELSSEVSRELEMLLAGLGQEMAVLRDLPEVAAALKPLLAFQGEMAKQGKMALFFGVKEVFAAQLASCLNATR